MPGKYKLRHSTARVMFQVVILCFDRYIWFEHHVQCAGLLDFEHKNLLSKQVPKDLQITAPLEQPARDQLAHSNVTLKTCPVSSLCSVGAGILVVLPSRCCFSTFVFGKESEEV